MVKTFEEATEEEAENREKGESPVTFGGVSAADKWEDVESLLMATPRGVIGSSNEPTSVRERVAEQSGEVREGVSNQVNVNLDSISEAISNIENQDLSKLNNKQLLQSIINQLTVTNKVLRVISETQIESLSGILTVAEDTSKPSAITVSGINSIDNAEQPETVVPSSDEKSIPTKKLYLRADESNSDPIYFGDDGIEPDRGFIMKPGESLQIEMDLRSTALYMASKEKGQQVQILGVF